MDARWRTSFGRWVSGYTVSRLVSELRARGITITSHAIYEQIAGRTAPRREVAMTMTRISRGKLSLDDIYRHRDKVGRPELSRSACFPTDLPESP